MNDSQRPAAAPSGVVTFLFTDIEGSTRRWEADADAMRLALETHDEVLREAVKAHQGWVFKHTGDGVCAVFTSPGSAVDAAVAAQRGLQLPVRMGIATGEAQLRGEDYFGAVLNRASRVMSCGHGAQILLDGATAALLNTVDLADLGPRRLRDLARPVEVFQVRAPGLRSEFPPLRALDATPGNLPPQITSFVGRESELAEVAEALAAHRLVTLTGVGGVGKTRLAGADEAGAVVEICRRLDGIPLGIELAASRLQSMTVTELRDRLDDRFRLLVGSRRGLERHQTLRHAVQWSYELLDDSEKTLLARCSVFAGGFDLAGACAVSGTDDELATLDLLDALVRKSLVVADRTSGRTRFSMLETIRQFGEEQLVASGEAEEARAAHAHYFAGREAEVLALWDSPRQREAYAWFAVELANLRAAFRWAADHGDLDDAAAIAVYATFLGFWAEQHEPIAWAEELIEPAKAVAHRRLAQLYVMAAQCFAAGRAEEALGYAEAAQLAIASRRFDQVPFEAEVWLGGGYLMSGHTEQWIELCRTMIEREPGPLTFPRPSLVFGLTFAGSSQEAVAACQGLLTAAEAINNPCVVSFTLAAYGHACLDVDPVGAYDALRRGLKIARDSGNRRDESIAAVGLWRLAATHGDPDDAFESLTLAIRNCYDSGSFAIMRSPLAILAAFLDRLGHHEPAATITGLAANPFTRTALPEVNTAITHLREVLGNEAYESLATAGEHMPDAAMAVYALDQIDQARGQLNRPE